MPILPIPRQVELQSEFRRSSFRVKLSSLARELTPISHEWLFTRPRFDKEAFSALGCPKMNDPIDARGFYLILGDQLSCDV